MTGHTTNSSCLHTERVTEYLLGTMSATEVAEFEQHLAGCASCRHELAAHEPVVEHFVDWPTDVLRPTAPLWDRLERRLGFGDVGTSPSRWREPEWKEVAPGISCKLLAKDAERQRISMLVRLAPGVAYPPHTHEGVEELHLLDGELWINDRKLYPGDYNYGAPGAFDERVWSETGCTCVLITSTKDRLA